MIKLKGLSSGCLPSNLTRYIAVKISGECITSLIDHTKATHEISVKVEHENEYNNLS